MLLPQQSYGAPASTCALSAGASFLPSQCGPFHIQLPGPSQGTRQNGSLAFRILSKFTFDLHTRPSPLHTSAAPGLRSISAYFQSLTFIGVLWQPFGLFQQCKYICCPSESSDRPLNAIQRQYRRAAACTAHVGMLHHHS
jgi:hypothetical protein